MKRGPFSFSLVSTPEYSSCSPTLHDTVWLVFFIFRILLEHCRLGNLFFGLTVIGMEQLVSATLEVDDDQVVTDSVNSNANSEFRSAGEYQSMRLPSTAEISVSSELLSSLFGQNFGACWGEFSCSHTRIPGKLYVCASSVLFYSSVLGFERKLVLPLIDIVSMELHRTTSIKLCTRHDEVYIFRSFRSRESVLDLLKRLARGQFSRDRLRTVSTESMGVSDSSDVCSPLDTRVPPVPAPQSTPMRRRAASDSFLRNLIDASRGSTSNSNNTSSSFDIGGGGSIDDDSRHQVKWFNAKKEMSAYNHEGIPKTTLPCSIERFIHLFLRDNAEHSLEKFQDNIIRDRDVCMTKWEALPGSGGGTMTRTLSFVHPISNSIGIGPSSAKTKRKQSMQRFGAYGMILRNVTNISGVPASDCFYIKDQWLIESIGDQELELTTRFSIEFTKSIPLKALIIEKTSRNEYNRWYRSYRDMVLEALHYGETHIVPTARASNEEKFHGTVSVLRVETFFAILCAIFCIYIQLSVKAVLYEIHVDLRLLIQEVNGLNLSRIEISELHNASAD